MKIKKFKAKTFAGALELVKKELSKDAVILATEETRGLRPFVEITAAVDYDNELSGYKTGPYSQASGVSVDLTGYRNAEGEKRAGVTGSPAGKGSGQPGFYYSPETRHTKSSENSAFNLLSEDLKGELRELREVIEGLRTSGYELALPEKKRLVLNFLKERAVHEDFALRLCEKVMDLNDIAGALSSDITVKDPENGKKIVMLVGPTGVGKTTTIAKLAANAVKKGLKAAIINLDTYRIGAVEQVRIYARILGIPMTVASGAEELRSSIENYAKTRDMIFIDTTGRNPMDETYIKEMQEICGAGVPIEVHLLISANCDAGFMIEAYKSYSKLPIDYIAFTKVDEAVKFGSLYNLLLTYGKPVSYVTTGQTVPDDIEFATVSRLSSMILTKGCYKC